MIDERVHELIVDARIGYPNGGYGEEAEFLLGVGPFRGLWRGR